MRRWPRVKDIVPHASRLKGFMQVKHSAYRFLMRDYLDCDFAVKHRVASSRALWPPPSSPGSWRAASWPVPRGAPSWPPPSPTRAAWPEPSANPSRVRWGADVPTILERHYASSPAGLSFFAERKPTRTRGGRPEESHCRTGPGRWIDRSADHSCRYCIGLLRLGGLCSERDAQRRRGHALRSSTGVRLWPGPRAQHLRV